MRTRTRVDTLYNFSELSDKAKEAALEELRDLNTSHDWWDAVYDDAKQCGAILGIEIDTIYFSGFWSQGDGACFEGSYRYAKGAVKAIAKHTGNTDAALVSIAQRLQDVQRPALYTATASCRQSGHYSHSGCMRVECDAERGTLDWQELTDTLRAFADWVYARLEKEYEYLTSDAAVIESIEANEYEFTEAGALAR